MDIAAEQHLSLRGTHTCTQYAKQTHNHTHAATIANTHTLQRLSDAHPSPLGERQNTSPTFQSVGFGGCRHVGIVVATSAAVSLAHKGHVVLCVLFCGGVWRP